VRGWLDFHAICGRGKGILEIQLQIVDLKKIKNEKVGVI